ncbi:DUF2752 domain-containing protein [Psychroserpens sp. NJDZ02]|nr:DUF2752 domain-containing protein [Psychroserpens sp. NJDZ02]
MLNDRRAYIITNISLILIFLLGLVYLLFSEHNLICYYKQNFNVLCNTCGLTRDFKSILRLDFDNLINKFSLYFFLFLMVFSFSRILTTLLLFKKINVKKVLIIDCVLNTMGTLIIACKLFW